MIEELNEGEAIVPRSRQLERDAAKWKILSISEGEDPCVTFQAGTYTNGAGMVIPVIFKCYKSGMIYKEWKKEAARRAAGGPIIEKEPYIDITAEPVSEFISKIGETKTNNTPIALIVDSQLEERQRRVGDLRKKAAALDWCNHDKDICTGKCKVVDEIRDIEKKILGDP